MEKNRNTFFLVMLLLVQTISWGQSGVIRNYRDGIKFLFTRSENISLMGGTLLLSLAALPVDPAVKRYAQDKGLMSDDLARVGDGFGGAYGHWILLGGQTVDYLIHSRSRTAFREEITYSLAALSFNGFTTVVLKELVGRERPNGRGNRSYPSGHTSHSFTIATICQELYGPKIGLPVYGMAVLVALSRIHDNKHYLSDVIMGAGLGTAIGRGFAQSYLKENVTVDVTPVTVRISIWL
ncbi:MAG: phosphatase PAP2 family protein [Fidelibacterota bacterium]